MKAIFLLAAMIISISNRIVAQDYMQEYNDILKTISSYQAYSISASVEAREIKTDKLLETFKYYIIRNNLDYYYLVDKMEMVINDCKCLWIDNEYKVIQYGEIRDKKDWQKKMSFDPSARLQEIQQQSDLLDTVYNTQNDAQFSSFTFVFKSGTLSKASITFDKTKKFIQAAEYFYESGTDYSVPMKIRVVYDFKPTTEPFPHEISTYLDFSHNQANLKPLYSKYKLSLL